MADQCQDLEVMNVYAALGARWIMHGENCPTAPSGRRLGMPQPV
jgi:hypothetical protein